MSASMRSHEGDPETVGLLGPPRAVRWCRWQHFIHVFTVHGRQTTVDTGGGALAVATGTCNCNCLLPPVRATNRIQSRTAGAALAILPDVAM